MRRAHARLAPRRWQLWALALVLAATSLAGCGGSSSGESGSAKASTPAAAVAQDVQGVQETQDVLKGIPQDGLRIGDPKAPVTLLEILDLQCPFCKQHHLETHPKVLRRLVRTGRVQLHMIPVAFLGPDSQRMEIVLLRLARASHAWEFASLVFWNQGREGSGYATDAWLRSLASAIAGVEPDAASTTPDKEIAQTAQVANALAQTSVRRAGGGGTPFFTIGKSGTPAAAFTPILSGAPPDAYETILKAVKALEAGKEPKELHVGPPVKAPSTAKGA